MSDKLIIYTDGGARGNPGPAAVGVVIYDASGKELERFGKHIGVTTNNQAEYRALLVALEMAGKTGANSLVCHLDSELVVRQLQGKYKVRESTLAEMATEALRLTSQFKQVEFVHVPREKNKLADQLVNEALDKAGF
ncbi:MAG: ribonuclease HI family protein [Candidatus Doudnabacteria bacterium]|nr:ribonuclease HI family protein [Candidatus Doudnabacteria bacterium]